MHNHNEYIETPRDCWGMEYGNGDEEIAPDNTEKMAEMTKITDDNDNLVEIAEDEWTEDKYTDEWDETPGGFAKLSLDLDEDVIAGLVDVWARENLSEASLEQYNDVLATDGQIAAIHGAVVNEIIIEALTQQIDRMTDADVDAEDV